MSIWLPRRPLPIVFQHQHALLVNRPLHLLAYRAAALNPGRGTVICRARLVAKRWESTKPETTNKDRLPAEPKTAAATVKDNSAGLPLATRVWEKVKHEAHHYWSGTKLLVSEVRISARLQWKILQGETLTRRERRQVSLCFALFSGNVA